MNDLVRLACERAAQRFGSADTFNAACFAAAFKRLAGVDQVLDGENVRAILTGRPDVEVLKGGCHFRLHTAN